MSDFFSHIARQTLGLTNSVRPLWKPLSVINSLYNTHFENPIGGISFAGLSEDTIVDTYRENTDGETEISTRLSFSDRQDKTNFFAEKQKSPLETDNTKTSLEFKTTSKKAKKNTVDLSPNLHFVNERVAKYGAEILTPNKNDLVKHIDSSDSLPLTIEQKTEDRDFKKEKNYNPQHVFLIKLVEQDQSSVKKQTVSKQPIEANISKFNHIVGHISHQHFKKQENIPKTPRSIEITIGQVEVRANIVSQAVGKRQRPAKPNVAMSLDQYLKQRSGSTNE